MMGQATTDAVTAARELAPELSARAVEAEQLRTLPRDLVERARAAELFRLATPRALGGLELPPAEIVEVVEELCRADGSAGWTIMIGNGSAFLAWLDPAAATELTAAVPDPIGGGVFAPMGRLTSDGDGKFGLTGRWAFCSGSPHADLFFGGAFADGDPRDWRLAFVPAAGVRVLDNWDVTGLRGTGSHDVEIEAVVRAEHTASPFTNPARHEGPLWRFPFFTLVGTMMAGVPLGIARRALDEFTMFAPAKFRPPGPGPIAEDGDVQIALTRAEGQLRSARAFVFDALGELWETACAGDVPDVARRGQFLLATQQAMQASLNAVTTAFGFAGAGRCTRTSHCSAASATSTRLPSTSTSRRRLRSGTRSCGSESSSPPSGSSHGGSPLPPGHRD